MCSAAGGLWRQLPDVKPTKALIHLARYTWAAPCSAIGLIAALPAILTGGRPRLIGGVLEVAVAAPGTRMAGLMRHSPFGAITFGHVIIGVDQDQLAQLRDHEQQHVRQYELWGPLFFLAYPASSLMQLMLGRDPYRDNHFEVQAREQAGQ